MSNKKYIFPAFDTLELQPQLAYTTQTYIKLQPVKVGNIVNNQLNQLLAGKTSQVNGYPHTNNFVSRPDKILVIYFYSKHWGNLGLAHLKQLHSIRHEIRYQDGNLLIIDADGDQSGLQEILWANGLALQVHQDVNNQIAALFNVYSENSPSWNRYPGVDVNIPLPATYVLDHALQVVFDHSNEELSTRLPLEQIVGKVYQSNNYLARSKSA